MSITATLGSLDISSYIRDDVIDTGTPVFQSYEVGGFFADINRQINQTSSGLVKMTIPMLVEGSSADNLISILDGIRDEVRKPTNTLTMKPDGATNSVTFNIVRNPHISVPWDRLYNQRYKAVFNLTLIREPWAYGSTQTPLNASARAYTVDTIAMSTLAVVGDVPTPLTIRVEPDTGEANVHSVWVAHCPTSFTDFKVEAESLTWAGGTTGAGITTYASGGASKKNESTSYAYANIDTASFPDGTWLVLARVAMADAADTGTFSLDAGTTTVTFDPDDALWHWIELDVLRLPYYEVRGSATANLTVYMKSSDGVAGNGVHMDCLAFLPLSLDGYEDTGGFQRFHGEETHDFTSVRFDGSNRLVYLADTANLQYTSGHGVKALGTTGSLVLIAEEVNPNAATYSAKVTVSYTPRYEQWR